MDSGIMALHLISVLLYLLGGKRIHSLMTRVVASVLIKLAKRPTKRLSGYDHLELLFGFIVT